MYVIPHGLWSPLDSDLGHWLVLLHWPPGISSCTSSIQTFMFGISSAWDSLLLNSLLTYSIMIYCDPCSNFICWREDLFFHPSEVVPSPPRASLSIPLSYITCLFITTCVLCINLNKFIIWLFYENVRPMKVEVLSFLVAFHCNSSDVLIGAPNTKVKVLSKSVSHSVMSDSLRPRGL